MRGVEMKRLLAIMLILAMVFALPTFGATDYDCGELLDGEEVAVAETPLDDCDDCDFDDESEPELCEFCDELDCDGDCEQGSEACEDCGELDCDGDCDDVVECDVDCDCADCDDGSGNYNTGGGWSPQPAVRHATIVVGDPNAREDEGQTRVFFARQTFELEPGETAYSLLHRTGLSISSRGHVAWGGMYVDGINGFGEFDDGPLSGWKYSVNGYFPGFSSANYELRDGDRVEWLFTRDLGSDVLGGWIDDDDETENPTNPNDSDESANNTGSGSFEFQGNNTENTENEDEYIEEIVDDVVKIEWENPFSDVAEDSWFYEYVRFVNVNELMNGISADEFSPNTNLSRAMMITILARIADVDTNGGETWYSVAVEWAMENGISDGSALQENVTREQIAVMLWRTLDNEPLTIDCEYSTGFAAAHTGRFSDWNTISNWAIAAMFWASSNGIVAGRTMSTLAPQGFATRAEAAAILQRFMEMT